jgi:hypothetical protein
MCPARSDDHSRIVGDQISPLARKSGELAGIIVEEDSVLAPRLPAFDQLEDAASQRMEGMGNPKRLRCTARRRCN